MSVALNDRFMLPRRVRTMEQMADLLDAEQTELVQTQRAATALENQLTISTSTFLLPRYEKIFALPVNTTESLEVRRARILAKLNTNGITTVKAIRELVKLITGREGSVEEHFDLYRFTVIINLLLSDGTVALQELTDQIEVMKPAHLNFDLLAAFEPSLFEDTAGAFSLHRFVLSLSFSNRRNLPPVLLDGGTLFDGSVKFDAVPASLFGFPVFQMNTGFFTKSGAALPGFRLSGSFANRPDNLSFCSIRSSSVFSNTEKTGLRRTFFTALYRARRSVSLRR